MSQETHASPEGRGRHPREDGTVYQAVATKMEPFDSEAEGLMEEVVGRENMMAAFERVEKNDGAPGVDGMTVGALWPWLHDHWSRIKVELLEDRYTSCPVQRVEIPKPEGKGMRQLGIPTVLDRLIQQALHQVLSPIFDPGFSERSYGFRRYRSAQDAVEQARVDMCEGRRWIVDLDMEKFFDRVDHDLLMARVARKVKDKRVLRLIRKYLRAGVKDGGEVSPTDRGTPQGGPLSPLLSNILLDDLDKELERRGHAFCRYADDCIILVRSRRSGERVLTSVTQFLATKLKLQVNREKSAVDRPWKRTFLGYTFTCQKQPWLQVAPSSVQRFRGQLRQCLRRGRGRNLSQFVTYELAPKIRGWFNYFRYCETKGVFVTLDEWLRRRLRNIIWRQWKRPRTRLRKLMERGLDEERARRSTYNGRGPWWNSGASHMNAAFPTRYFDDLGLVSLRMESIRFRNRIRTAVVRNRTPGGVRGGGA